MQKFLVGDLGGTKAELALYEEGGEARSPFFKKLYRAGEFSSAEKLLHQFLSDAGERVSAISLGVAGPVSDNRAEVTNLPWNITVDNLEKEFGVTRISLINDLTAVCAGIPVLKEEDILVLQEGSGQNDEMFGVIAPGTGLGVGMMFFVEDKLYLRGTEGGHTDFAPFGDEQLALLNWLQVQKRKAVSSEMVCAGPAIADIYDFCAEYHALSQSAWVLKKFESGNDRSAVIGEAAIAAQPCPLCKKAMDLFFRIVGGEAANLALAINAVSGIYLGGGILPRFVDHFSFEQLLEAFNSRAGRAPFMANVPLRLIMRRDVALLGAARYILSPELFAVR